jgi:hypothetical protein
MFVVVMSLQLLCRRPAESGVLASRVLALVWAGVGFCMLVQVTKTREGLGALRAGVCRRITSSRVGAGRHDGARRTGQDERTGWPECKWIKALDTRLGIRRVRCV